MINISIDEILCIIYSLYDTNKRILTTQDIDECKDLPSYNTCLRKGLELSKLNNIYSEKIYYSNPKLCKACHVAIPYNKKNNTFCSASCSATHNNTGRIRSKKTEDFDLHLVRKKRYKIVKNNQNNVVFLFTNCINCGIEIAQSSTGNRKYCSNSCHKDHNLISRFRDWYEYGKYFSNDVIRNHLEILHGYYCSCCGISEWNGKKIVLEVEHIDGNSENSSKENVCLLCPNCHSQTPTYKGKNVGNGRYSRRIRYQEGKSY